MIELTQLQNFKDDLDAFLLEAGEKYNIKTGGVKIKYDELGFKVNFEAKTLDVNADEVMIDNYAYDHYGVSKAYGKTVYVGGKAMTVCGLDNKARKYKVLVKDADGKCFGAVAGVLEQLCEI